MPHPRRRFPLRPACQSRGKRDLAVTGQAQLGYRAAEVGCGTTVDLPWRRVSLVSKQNHPTREFNDKTISLRSPPGQQQHYHHQGKIPRLYIYAPKNLTQMYSFHWYITKATLKIAFGCSTLCFYSLGYYEPFRVCVEIGATFSLCGL